MTTLALAGGGTGGHVYPLLAVADALRSRQPAPQLIYLGTAEGLERELVARAGIPFSVVAAGAIRGRSPAGIAVGATRQLAGVVTCVRLLRRRRPAAVLATGGYVSVPPVLAAWLLRIPTLVYLPDVRPGLAVRVLAPIATRVATTSEASRRYLPAGKVVPTGYPVRQALLGADRAGARQRLHLGPDESCLFVVGGSRGARSINQAVAACVADLTADWRVIHVCGADDEPAARAVRDALPAPSRARYQPHAFLHTPDMADALAAADLVVSRSGASVLGEYPVLGVASVLVPLPFAGVQQRPNAELLANAGAAVILDNDALRQGQLAPTVGALLAAPGRIPAMRAAAATLARPDAAAAIARELLALTGPQ